MRLIELSHVVTAGMVTYPGLPGPELGSHLSFEESHGIYAAGTEFSMGRISMVTNTGTYLDTPAHRYRAGHDLTGATLERCALLPCLVVDGPAEGPVPASAFAGLDVAGTAVLVRTGWDAHFGTPRYGDPAHPSLSPEAARALVDGGAVLVGIDSVNIDPTDTGERPIHTTLLGADVLVVEHLTGLGAVPATGATFTACPVRVAGLATFPVRAFAAVPDAPAADPAGAGARPS